ncbi:hypothetical protein D3C78_1640190 [compost metagenome]
MEERLQAPEAEGLGGLRLALVDREEGTAKGLREVRRIDHPEHDHTGGEGVDLHLRHAVVLGDQVECRLPAIVEKQQPDEVRAAAHQGGEGRGRPGQRPSA